ncbi:MAG: ethanolamine ammonia-lyase reactivating factor EutA [Treponemataceae bacterium]
MSETIFSVGIDIGTTTSQIIFSSLTLQTTSAISRIPQVSITDKKIIYASPIYMTPLTPNNEIDGKSLANIVQNEYRSAQMTPKDITVGAVIITGESSRKNNAQEIVHDLGDLAGDFVVASAGPDLEGIIAARGAGAAKLSKDKHGVVANIDIGGGTSNIAIFDNGVPIDTACFDIGGRQIRFKKNTFFVEYINPKTQKLCQKMGLSIEVGKEATINDLEKLCKRYVEILTSAIGFRENDSDEALMMTDHPLKHKGAISYVSFSGGVASVFYHQQDFQNIHEYGDIGVIFGNTLKKHLSPSVTIIKPEETIRATVIGAGAFTASLSGSTVDAHAEHLLPLKNLPVIKLSLAEEESDEQTLRSLLQKKISWVKDSSAQGIALGFTMSNDGGYERLKIWAQAIAGIADEFCKNNYTLAIIVENDYAKALGQILRMQKDFAFIVLDGIKLQDGDFLDVGKPLMEHSVVPVIVKTLVFK